MNECDKCKLKVIIKMILIQRSPKKLSSKQLANIINKYDWGFRSEITSIKVGKLIGYELNKRTKHFMDDIETSSQRNGTTVYYINKSKFS